MNYKEIDAYKDGFIAALNMRDQHKIMIFGMDVGKVLNILAEHIKKEQSEVPDIPIGYSFNWSKRKEVNEFFEQLANQGFEVVKK